jgi:quinol monooxygenase YgiN
MAFVQMIEFSTTRQDEIRALVDDYRASTEGARSTGQGMVCADRDQPNRFVTIVEFESYEAAMKNSELPETAAMAAKMAELCDGPPTFRNLDVVDTIEA